MTCAAFLVVGDDPERMRNVSAFAHLCAVALRCVPTEFRKPAALLVSPLHRSHVDTYFLQANGYDP
jgi:hypothetical protein